MLSAWPERAPSSDERAWTTHPNRRPVVPHCTLHHDWRHFHVGSIPR